MKYINKYAQSLCFAWLVKLSSLIKVSFVWGSQIAWFSVSPIFTPLSGAFLGIFGSSLVLLVRCLMHLVVFKTFSASFLAFIIPGYCASLYFATHNKVIKIGIPLLCLFLFVMHPVGAQVWYYSLYWLIPVVVYCVHVNSLFLIALGSTFVAHAVGSVIWLYAVPSTTDLWVGLIPVVAIERLFFAIGMVVIYNFIVGLSNVKASCMYYGWKSAVGYKSRLITKSRAS